MESRNVEYLASSCWNLTHFSYVEFTVETVLHINYVSVFRKCSEVKIQEIVFKMVDTFQHLIKNNVYLKFMQSNFVE